MYSLQEEREEIVFSDRVEGISLRLPKKNFAEFVLGPDSPVPEKGFLDRAFASPLDTPTVKDIAKGKKKGVVIVSDSTRNVPTAKVLPHIMAELTAGGMNKSQITLIVAVGVHRPATGEEMGVIAGNAFNGRIEIVNHDPYSSEGLISFGTTSRGTPVEISRLVADSDLRVIVGKVEPHEFAGFSGGRKSILPGVSSEKTIRMNHRPEMILDPHAAIGVLEGNPIHEDMMEAAKMVGVNFCVNILCDGSGQPFSVVCGALEESHKRAVELLRGFIALPLTKRPGIVLATPGYPLNIDLYQTIKTIIAAAPIMKKNGVVILYSNCTEGTGSVDMLTPFEEGRGPDGAIEYLYDNYKIQMDHSLLLCKILQTGVRVILVSPNVKPAVVEQMGMIPAESLETAVKVAFKLAGGDEKITILPCPQRYLPFVKE